MDCPPQGSPIAACLAAADTAVVFAASLPSSHWPPPLKIDRLRLLPSCVAPPIWCRFALSSRSFFLPPFVGSLCLLSFFFVVARIHIRRVSLTFPSPGHTVSSSCDSCVVSEGSSSPSLGPLSIPLCSAALSSLYLAGLLGSFLFRFTVARPFLCGVALKLLHLGCVVLSAASFFSLGPYLSSVATPF